METRQHVRSINASRTDITPSWYLDEASRDESGQVNILRLSKIVDAFRNGNIRLDSAAAEQLLAAEMITASLIKNGDTTWGQYREILMQVSEPVNQ